MLRNVLNQAAAEALHRFARFLPLPRKAREAARVLVYHAIGDPVDLHRGFSLTVTRDSFRWQMQELRNKFNVVALHEIRRHLEDQQPFPPRTVAITFDDGYRDNFTEALPILNEFALPATFFISTGLLDGIATSQFPTLTASQVREISQCGMEIGSHSHEHRPLVTCSDKEAMAQLSGSRKRLEEISISPVVDLSYPFGGTKDTPAAKRPLARQCGYLTAYSALYGGITANSVDRFFLPRIAITHRDTTETFRRKLDGRYDRMRYLQILRDACLYNPEAYYRQVEKQLERPSS